MNKRLNSVLFILGATIANIIVMILVFAVLMVIFARFVAPLLTPMVNQIILLVLFIGSVVITYVLYHRLMRYLSQRYNLEEYFGPLFGKGGKGR
jgi:membrane protein implicated in regulation of membrane protease activity